jgi:exfoliative toxin A/B
MIQKQNIINLPVAIAGISLGFLTLATIWDGLGFTFLRHVSVLFAITCIVLLLIKLVLDPRKVLSEFKNPMTGSLSFTATMAIMAISNYISKYHLQLAKFIWLSAIVLHIVMLLVFIFFMRKNFTFDRL